MEKRTLLAVLICLVVLFAYQMYFAPQPPPPKSIPEESPAPEPQEAEILSGEPESLEPVIIDDETVAEAVIKGEKRKKVTVETEVFRLEFSNVGGKLTSCKLKNYKQAVDRDDRLDLIEKETAFGVTPFEFFSDKSAEVAKLNHVIYETAADQIDLTGRDAPDTAEVTFSYSDGRQFHVEKIFTFHKQDYLVDIEVRLHKTGEAEGIYFLWGPGLAPDKKDQKKKGLFSGMGGGINRGTYLLGEKPEHLDLKDVEYIKNISGYLEWLGCENNYFTTLFLPARDRADARPVSAMFLKTKGLHLNGGQGNTEIQRLTAGMTLEGERNRFSIYMGPKDYDLLKTYGRNMEKIIDFGWFGALAKGLLFTLKFIYQYLPNYGVAIIILTFIINILFYPLKHKQIKSMQKMQALQPKINAIKDKYKKLKDAQSRQKMNQETMGLYKKEGVNPLGGCLPLLVQLPFFYGFFRLLSVSIELRPFQPATPFTSPRSSWAPACFFCKK